MGEEGKSFGAIVVASLAIIMGSKYLVTAMIVGMAPSNPGIPMLLESTLVTAIAGGVLVLVAGGFISAVTFTRGVAFLTFAGVAVAGKPWVGPLEPVVIAESVLAVCVCLYLLVHDPIRKSGRTDVDESTSASRIGSTIR